MVERVLTGQVHMPTDRFDCNKLRKAVEKYYDAKAKRAGILKAFCLVVGWFDSNHAKAAHIVPNLPKSEELAHMYGVGEVVQENPRNGNIAPPFLTLSRSKC